jgi:hypothetical protein
MIAGSNAVCLSGAFPVALLFALFAVIYGVWQIALGVERCNRRSV